MLHRLATRNSGWVFDPYIKSALATNSRDAAIEIMGSDKTRQDIISLLKIETLKHGFEPFHVRKLSTGYIYNR